jgi:hypothetical protein
MLQPRHLVLIRAALQFWDEEQSPHGIEAFTGYVEEPLPGGELTTEDVEYLRLQLGQCESRYLLCDEEGSELIGQRLFETVDAAAQADSEGAAMVAAALIFSGTR